MIGADIVLDVVDGELQVTPCAICSRADSLHGSIAAAGATVVALAGPGANDAGDMPDFAVEPIAAGAVVDVPDRTSAASAGSATSSAIIAIAAHGNRASPICMGGRTLSPQVNRIDHVLLLA